MRKFKKIWILFVIALCLVGCQKEEDIIDIALQEDVELTEEEPKESSIYVYVCGAVKKEGVYELPAGSRVYEAVELAGGFQEDAATAQVNQAEILVDAMKLYIPTTEEILERESSGNGKININQASKEELMTLPGIGEAKAESIIRYREENGRFQKPEDIMEISGIKESLYENIKELIQV